MFSFFLNIISDKILTTFRHQLSWIVFCFVYLLTVPHAYSVIKLFNLVLICMFTCFLYPWKWSDTGRWPRSTSNRCCLMKNQNKCVSKVSTSDLLGSLWIFTKALGAWTTLFFLYLLIHFYFMLSFSIHPSISLFL